MKKNSQKTNRKIWLAAALGWALLILFAQPQTVSAQQWTGPDGNSNISNTNTGNVGIGTTSPTLGKLQVTGAVGNTSAVFGSDGTGVGLIQNWGQIGFNTYFNAGFKAINSGFGGTVGVDQTTGGIFFRTANTVTGAGTAQTQIERMRIDNSGNVGIGTASPAGLLDARLTPNGNSGLLVNYSVNNGTYLRAGSASVGDIHIGDIVTRNVLLGESGGVNVGIGTTAPLYKLDVNGEINATGFRINGTPISTSSPVASVFGRTGAVVQQAGDYTWQQITKTSSSLADLQTRSASDLNAGTVPIGQIGLSGNAGVSTFLRGDNTWGPVPSSQWISGTNNISYSSGNVGIGTTTPNSSYMLDVNGNTNITGNINVTGNINAKYQDVAEWVPSTHALPAGTVVTLDPTKSNHVEASSKSYDTRVAGVISEQPGIALGEPGDKKVLVATTGRVRLKVDASNGPIQVGDLLVTSDIPGMAMKSKAIDVGGVEIHRPGTLIGKALEPLAKGRGEILVLLSLH